MGCTTSAIYGETRNISISVGTSDDDVLSRPKVSLPLMQRGVRLWVAKDVLKRLSKVHESAARDDLLRKPSHGEVIVNGLVKAFAKDESYAEFLKRSPNTSNLIGEVNVFVTHAWGSSFEETVHALQEFEAELPVEAPPVFYFIDFFAINQWAPTKDLDKLGEIVQQAQKLLLMFSPWEKPATMGRSWCIFEAAHAVIGDTEIVLSMSPTEKRKFRETIEERFSKGTDIGKFSNFFSSIDSQSSKSSIKEDSVQIKAFIEKKLGGYNAVDQNVANALRGWLSEQMKTECEAYRSKGTNKHAKFLLTISTLFYALRKYNLQLKYAKQALDIFEDVGTELDAIHARNSVAIAHFYLGRYSEAINVGRQQHEVLTRKYGALHPDTITNKVNLASFYYKTKEWGKAEALLRSALNDRKKTKINNISAEYWLALVLRDNGKDVEKAKQLFKQILDKQIQSRMLDHEVQRSAVDYARCLELKGSKTEALQIYTKAYPILLQAYGKNDIYVKNVTEWIGNLSTSDERKK